MGKELFAEMAPKPDVDGMRVGCYLTVASRDSDAYAR